MMRRLYTPGPVELSPAVVEAMSRQPLSHKSQDFVHVTQDVCNNLQWLLGTAQPVALLSGSGTTAIEATMSSLAVHGAPCLVLVHGRFGERLQTMLRTLGATVYVCSAEWGTAIAPSAVEEALASMPTPHSVWLVHSETSTGVTLDLQGIAEVIQNAAPKALLCVDAVTSVGIHTLPMDAWSLDAVMTGSQKGLCAPPGLGVVALSQRARLYAQQQPATTTILHLPTIIESLQTCGMFPWTPPVTVVAALQAALSEIRAEGHDATWDKHRRVTKALHDGLRQRGFHLYGQGSSHAVSVVQHPSPKPFLETVRRDFGITLAAGQDQLSDTVFRIGTCGGVTVSDVLHLLDVLQRANNSLSTT